MYDGCGPIVDKGVSQVFFGEFFCLEDAINIVGNDKTVQVCTNNACNYVVPGNIHMDKFGHLFWTFYLRISMYKDVSLTMLT